MIRIATRDQFLRELANPRPGCFFLMEDGSSLSYAGATQEKAEILAGFSSNSDPGYRIRALVLNTQPDRRCDVTGRPIGE